MAVDPAHVIAALNRRFLLDYPLSAAQRLESMDADDAAEVLVEHPASVTVPVFAKLAPDAAAAIIAKLPPAQIKNVVEEMLPNDAVRVLAQFGDERQQEVLATLESSIVEEIKRLMSYPPDSAGRLMEPRISYFRGSLTVEETVDRLRGSRAQATRSLFIVDELNKLSGRVSIQEIAVAPPGTRLRDIAQPVSATVNQITPHDEVVEVLEKHKLVDLPVVDTDGRLLGIIYHSTLIQAIRADARADIQKMVGASAEERALSKPMFAITKRLPWLQINLLTAFLAAAVVGLFESTIATFTALAVLLPVVAGQSGNAGAQALAVTMRGLALREITLRHWLTVTLKEVQVGFVNGIAVAVTCGIGVYLWSGSWGLVLVISLAMVLAMVAAGFAGAIVPIALTRIGQDPAQSSSIILTTVTDVTGFLAFLGIATLLASML
jgi:magnesium transporter